MREIKTFTHNGVYMCRKRLLEGESSSKAPWEHLYTTNVASLASLEATLKLVMVNGAALDVLTENVTLESIEGWAHVSRMFGALVFHSNTFWFAMMKRYVYIHHGQYMLYDFKHPYLECAKRRLPAKFHTCIQLNRRVIWRDGRRSWISNETYTYWQLQAHACLYLFVVGLDERHILQISSLIDGNAFEQRYSFGIIGGPWEYMKPWSSGRTDGVVLKISHVISELAAVKRGYNPLEATFEQGGVLQINFEYTVNTRL